MTTDTATSPATLQLHPWNTEFSWRQTQGPFQVLDETQAMQFDRDGYLVLDGVFEPELVHRVTEAIDPFERKVEAYLREHGHQAMQRSARRSEDEDISDASAITFTIHLVKRSEVLRSFARHPVLLGLCADLIGPDVSLYWDQAVYKKPENPRRFPWHQDNGYTYVEPQQYLTCWVALTDATVVNGCPQVVPGIHRLGTLQHHYVDPLGWECFEDPDGAVAAPVGAGGVVVFSSLTPHLTGPNLTDEARKAYILQYAAAGAHVLSGDPADGPPTGRQPCNAADRQFPVLRNGRPVG